MAKFPHVLLCLGSIAVLLLVILGALQWIHQGGKTTPEVSYFHREQLIRFKRGDDLSSCEKLLKKDGNKRPLPSVEDEIPETCEQATRSCWRGFCYEEICNCCGGKTGLTASYLKANEHKKIKKPYGRWFGDRCDKWEEWDEVGNIIEVFMNEDDVEDVTDEAPGYSPGADTQVIIGDGANRPVPSDEEKKNRPSVCKERTASCWRGYCDANNQNCYKCYTYDIAGQDFPGRYFGKYCDQFAVDYFVIAAKTSNFDCKLFCRHGACVWVPMYSLELCICDYGFIGQYCDARQKKSMECYNRGKSKSIKTSEGKAKYCKCRNGYGGLQCERAGVCRDAAGNSLCLTGTCERASLLGGKKGGYCKCPKDKKLKPKGPFCKPKNYTTAAAAPSWENTEGLDGAESCGPDKLQCVNGVCTDGTCVCDSKFGGESCDQPVSDGNTNQKVVVAVPARLALTGQYKEEMSNPRSSEGAAIKGSVTTLMAELKGRIENMVVTEGSVLIDFDAQFDSEGTADEPDTDFKQLLEDELKNQAETFDAGLGAEYKLDLKASKVGQPELRFLRNDTFDKTPGYGVLAGLVVLVLFVIAAIITIMKINANKKAEENKKKKDEKNKRSKKDKKSNQSLKTGSSGGTDKLSSKSTTKSTSLRSKSSGKSDGLKSKTSVRTAGLKSKTNVKNEEHVSIA